MAHENLSFVMGELAAAADYTTTGQYRGMVASTAANNTAVLASVAGQQIIGVLRNEPDSGEACEIVEHGVAKVILGGTVTRGDRLSVDASGAFVTATGAGAICGVAIQSGTSGAIISMLIEKKPLAFVTLPFQVSLAAIPAGDVVTSFPLPGSGRIVGFRYVPTVVTSTASDGMNLNLEIGTTNLTGGVLGLTSANTNTLGVVVSSTAITAGNTYAPGALLSIEGATGAGAFAEGSGTLHVEIELF
jgi:hypothetical protein